MKKIMIAVCAIAFAAVAQAATVTWNTGTLYAPGEDGTGWVDGWASPVVGDVSIQLIFSAASDLSNPLSVSGMSDSYTVDVGGWNVAGTATVDLSKPTTEDGSIPYYAQMIITYGDATLTSDIVTFNSVKGADPDLYFGDVPGGMDPLPDHEFSNITGAFPEETGWQTVPEPTSGLLLLLGVAGLALRRRRA